MSGYSDEWNDIRPRDTLSVRLRDEGYNIVWKPMSDRWAADHIQYLECQWCGVLVWSDRIHRAFCTTEPAWLKDIAPPPPPPEGYHG